MDLKDIKNTEVKSETEINSHGKKKVGFLLGLGIFFMPYFFSWFTLRKGHSGLSKGLSFAWMGLIILVGMNGSNTKTSNTHRGTASVKSKPAPKKELSFVSESCSTLANAFGASSKMSDIQKKERWKAYSGKAFKWDLQVSEVSEAMLGSGYQVQFKCSRSNSFISDVIMDFPKSSKSMVMNLQKGSLYTIKGKLEDYNSLIGLSAESL